MLFLRFAAFSFLIGSVLAGCGTRVPDLAEYPNNIDDAAKNKFVQDIIYSVRCELRSAVKIVVDTATANATLNNYKSFFATTFKEDWAAQVALTITVDEKTVVNPVGVWAPITPVSALFTLGGSASSTRDAARVEKINFFFKVKDLYSRSAVSCKSAKGELATGSGLIESDLKLGEWLNSFRTATDTGTITDVPKQNVLQHQVTFDVTRTAGVTPSWKLTLGSINQSGTFLSGTRQNKHDLVVTFAPLDKSTGSSLAAAGENAHATSQLSSAIKGAIVLGP